MSLAVCFAGGEVGRLVLPFGWLGAEVTVFVSGVVHSDRAIPIGPLRRLAGRLRPPRARENRHRGGPALYVSGGIIAFKSALELDLHPAGLEPALAKRLLHADGSVLLKTSTSCGFADLFESNHQLESRVQNVFFALMWCRARKPLA